MVLISSGILSQFEYIGNICMSESEQKKSLNHQEEELLNGKTIQEATEEVKEELLNGKTIQEATEEVIQEFGGRMSNDEIRELFD
jgi:hypothetical protein